MTRHQTTYGPNDLVMIDSIELSLFYSVTDAIGTVTLIQTETERDEVTINQDISF